MNILKKIKNSKSFEFQIPGSINATVFIMYFNQLLEQIFKPIINNSKPNEIFDFSKVKYIKDKNNINDTEFLNLQEFDVSFHKDTKEYIDFSHLKYQKGLGVRQKKNKYKKGK